MTRYYRDFFTTMQANAVAYVLRRLPDMITFWQSTQGQNQPVTPGPGALSPGADAEVAGTHR